MQKWKPVLIILLTFFISSKIYGQLINEFHEIVTVKDSVYYGKLINADTINLTFLTLDKVPIKFKIKEIKFIRLTDKMRIISDERSRIYSSQALYGETAIPIKKKTWYYSSSYIFDNRFRYAFNDYINLEAGNNPFINEDSPFDPYLGLKANVSLFDNNLHFATKYSYFLKNDDYGYYDEPYYPENRRKSMWSAMVTVGGREAAFTFSYNKVYNYDFDYNIGLHSSIYQFSGYVKVSPKNYLCIENIKAGKENYLTMIGVRHDRYSTSFTYGVLYCSNKESFESGLPLPYFSLKVPIESK